MARTKTVTVEWITTITEHHRAEVDAENWADMVKNDRIGDDLADYEGEESLVSLAVESREAWSEFDVTTATSSDRYKED